MEKQISLEQIRNFREKYNSNLTNKIIENAITKNGLENACINRDVIIENQPVFNIELPESKRYDQKESIRCWIYAGLNLIKHNVAQNMNIDVMKLELSSNYLSFYDRLEKANNTYENIISLENFELEYIRKEKILEDNVSEAGYWEFFKALVKKYGIIPDCYNPNVVEGENYIKLEHIYNEKVKKDVLELLELKRNNKKEDILRKTKIKFLEENYEILAKVLGEPTTEFDYEYKDKDGKYIKIEKTTPLEFKNKYLSLNLENFVTIGNMPMYNKEYGKMYQKKYMENVYKNSEVKYLNLPIERLKELSIKQLKDGIPVYFGTYTFKFRDLKSGVLDTRLYNYDKILNLNQLSKAESLDLNDISMYHAMVFSGVNVIDEEPKRWKVEDSYGTEHKVNGYYIMNDNFFSKFVLSVVIDKKYLNSYEQDLLKQEPIKFEVDEPF